MSVVVIRSCYCFNCSGIADSNSESKPGGRICKFVQRLPESRVGTANRKRHQDLDLRVPLCFRSSRQRVLRRLANFGSGTLGMDIQKIPAGRNPPADVNAVIEIPQGGVPVKYELDKSSGAMFVDRFLHTAMFYPGNYGFIPQTLSDDGDPVDILVVT